MSTEFHGPVSIRFEVNLPDAAEIVKKSIRDSICHSLHFVNAYSIFNIFLSEIKPRDLNNSYFIDSKPLWRYLVYANKSPQLHYRGVDFLRHSIMNSELRKYSQVILSFSITRAIELKNVFIDHGWTDDKIFIRCLDEEVITNEIPFLQDQIDFPSGVVWICSGTPKQDKMASALSKTYIGLTVGVGGAIDLITRNKAEAPAFIKKAYLEWFYRFIQEPVRLFRRYAVGNLVFVTVIAYDFIKRRRVARDSNSSSSNYLVLPHTNPQFWKAIIQVKNSQRNT